MTARRLRPPLIAAWILIGSGVAFAARDTGDRARAEHLLSQLGAGDTELVAEPVRSSRAALKRADDQRAAGDIAHAELTEGVAFEWAATAGALTRAAKLEAELAKVEKQISEVETKRTRARALVEETIARRERAKGKLKDLEPVAPTPAASAKPPAAKPPTAKPPAVPAGKPPAPSPPAKPPAPAPPGAP